MVMFEYALKLNAIQASVVDAVHACHATAVVDGVVFAVNARSLAFPSAFPAAVTLAFVDAYSE